MLSIALQKLFTFTPFVYLLFLLSNNNNNDNKYNVARVGGQYRKIFSSRDGGIGPNVGRDNTESRELNIFHYCTNIASAIIYLFYDCLIEEKAMKQTQRKR